MPEIITGATKVTDTLQSGLVLSMEAVAAELDPQANIFETITRKIGGVQSVGRLLHSWCEHRMIAMSTTTTAAAAVNATSIQVAVPNIGFRDMLVACPATGEVFAMDEDVGGTAVAGAIKVRRKTAATGTGISTAIPNGSVLVFLLESHAEGEDIPPAYATKETEVSTYVQQFDETIKVTDIADKEETYGPGELAKQRRRKYLEHMKRFNLNLYLGSSFREVASAGGLRRHGMAGLEEYLSPTAIDASGIVGGFTMRTFGTWIRPTKQYGASSTSKLGIMGQNAILHISSFPENYVRTVPGEQAKWGVSVKSLHTPFGMVDLVYDQLLTQEHGLADRMYILDESPGCLYQIQLNGMPWVVKQNVQNSNDIHNIQDAMTGTRGFVLKLPELHKMVEGIN